MSNNHILYMRSIYQAGVYDRLDARTLIHTFDIWLSIAIIKLVLENTY